MSRLRIYGVARTRAFRPLWMAKELGLDFEHVYLLQLHKTSPGDRGPTTEAARLPREATFAWRLFGAPTLDFDRVDAERRAVEAAERVRLLYVAMTRPKERLVLLGAWPQRPEPRPPVAVRSQLDLTAAVSALLAGAALERA